MNREQANEAFRQCLRLADKLIKEGNFEEAKVQIASAKKIDPTNSFIKAFEERIVVFRDKKATLFAAPSHAEVTDEKAMVSEVSAPVPVEVPSREMLEHHIRQELETEYKARFTQELRKAEEHAAKILSDERTNVELHRDALKSKFEHQLKETREQLEREFQKKLQEQLSADEARLDAQYRDRLAKSEKDLADKLAATHTTEQERLKNRVHEEQEELLSRERKAFEDRDQKLRNEFEQQLADALLGKEALIREELSKQHRSEEERIRKQLTAEFEARIAQEHEGLGKDLTAQKALLEESFSKERKRLGEEHRLRLEEQEKEILSREQLAFQERDRTMKQALEHQLATALRTSEERLQQEREQQLRSERENTRKQLTGEFDVRLAQEHKQSVGEFEEQKRTLEALFISERKKLADEHRRDLEQQEAELRSRATAALEQEREVLKKEIEVDLQRKYNARIEAERIRIEKDAEAVIEAEKQRLQREYDRLLAAQEEKVKALRFQLQRELEETFLRRMEQIANEYDYKMELLGTKVPTTIEEKTDLYRKKLRGYYKTGQPTEEEAKLIMSLKELLELSFDEHLLIEADVRLDLYAESVERRIVSGDVNLKDRTVLDDLKQQFRITAEEASRLEPYILSSIQRLAVKGRILLADDDLLLLQSLDAMLTDCGYQIIPAATVSDALNQLNSTSVDLILSDIKFGENELDGFQFFIAVQAQPHLRKIPFIFMSSLRDGVIIRSGVQLGVDDYLTKPIDPDLLIAVIEGKLKRYRAFDRN